MLLSKGKATEAWALVAPAASLSAGAKPCGGGEVWSTGSLGAPPLGFLTPQQEDWQKSCDLLRRGKPPRATEHKRAGEKKPPPPPARPQELSGTFCEQSLRYSCQGNMGR